MDGWTGGRSGALGGRGGGAHAASLEQSWEGDHGAGLLPENVTKVPQTTATWGGRLRDERTAAQAQCRRVEDCRDATSCKGAMLSGASASGQCRGTSAWGRTAAGCLNAEALQEPPAQISPLGARSQMNELTPRPMCYRTGMSQLRDTVYSLKLTCNVHPVDALRASSATVVAELGTTLKLGPGKRKRVRGCGCGRGCRGC